MGRVNRHAITAGCIALMLGAMAQAGDLPSYQAEYAIEAAGFDVGRYTSSLRPEGKDRFVYQAHTETTGWLELFHKDRIDERSVWTWFRGHIRPLHYRYHRSGGSKEKHVEVEFDWPAGSVRNMQGKDRWRLEIKDGVLDKQLVQLAMMLDLKRGKITMEYPIADGGKLKTWRFAVVGKERVKTAAGDYDTVKVERVRDNNRRTTYFWCAPKLHYLPVKADQREDDDAFHLRLLRFQSHTAQP